MKTGISPQILWQKPCPVNQVALHVQAKFDLCNVKKNHKDNACAQLGVTPLAQKNNIFAKSNCGNPYWYSNHALFQTTLGASQACYIDTHQYQYLNIVVVLYCFNSTPNIVHARATCDSMPASHSLRGMQFPTAAMGPPPSFNIHVEKIRANMHTHIHAYTRKGTNEQGQPTTNRTAEIGKENTHQASQTKKKKTRVEGKR